MQGQDKVPSRQLGALGSHLGDGFGQLFSVEVTDTQVKSLSILSTKSLVKIVLIKDSEIENEIETTDMKSTYIII